MKSHLDTYILVKYNNINELRSAIDNKFHYLYKIVNNINDKYYYGIHSTIDIYDGYKGSGKLLKDMYKKYENNCTKYIINFFEDRKSLLTAEKTIVTKEVITNNNCYNLIEGGIGTYNTINSEYTKHTTKNRIWINNGIKNKVIKPTELDKYLNNGWKYGELHSSTKGKIVVNNGITDMFIYEYELENYLSNGWKKGGISRNKGNKSFAKDLIWINNGISQKRISKDILNEYINNGWKKGTCQKTTKNYIRITNGVEIKNIPNTHIEELNYYFNNGWKKGSNIHRKNVVWINNGLKSTTVYLSELDNYLNNGWKKGRIINKPELPKRCAVNLNNVCKIIPLTELDNYLNNGWKKGALNRKNIHKN